MTSLGRVGRILAGTVDVTNSIADKDSYSTNASTMDFSAASTSNILCGTPDAINDRKTKPTTSASTHDSSRSSNDNTSQTSNTSAMILQGTKSIYQFYLEIS